MRPVRSTDVAWVLGCVLAVSTVGCDEDEPGPCVCTEEFRTYVVTVLDEADGLAVNVDVAVVRAASGDTLPYGDPVTTGTYRIMDDGFTGDIAPDESFSVGGRRSDGSFDVTYRFGTDDCRCHVEKLSGPDTVRLAR